MRWTEWMRMWLAVVPLQLALAASPVHGGAAAPGREADWREWTERSLARFTPTTPDELAQAKGNAQASLRRLEQQLAQRPDGAILEHNLDLPRLRCQLEEAVPQVDSLDQILERLSRRLPKTLQASADSLGKAVAQVRSSAIRSDPQASQAAVEAVGKLARALDRAGQADGQPSAATFEDVRAAYGYLVRAGHMADLLEPAREALSAPNEILFASQRYLVAAGRREFSVPLTLRTASQGAVVSAQGTLNLQSHLVLVPNDQRGELEFHVDGQGCAR